MTHEQIGAGNEHTVYQSKIPDLVLKKPTPLSQLMFWLFNIDPHIIRTEHQLAEHQLNTTSISTPNWRVFILPQFNKKFGPITLKKGYITVQQKVTEDHSLSPIEIEKIFQKEHQTYLLERYRRHPDNFITQNGKLYLVDPTKSFTLPGIIDRKGILSKRRYHRMKKLIKNDLASLHQYFNFKPKQY